MTSEFAKRLVTTNHNVGILISIIASYNQRVWHVYQLSSISHRSVFSKVSRLRTARNLSAHAIR